MYQETIDILTNNEAIAVDQDALGKQGIKVRDDGDSEVWVKPLADGSRAVVLFNRSQNNAEIAVSWIELGYPLRLKAEVRDLWKHKNLGRYKRKFSAEVPSHDVVMIKITP
jgi:alpha-galactosidase